MGSRWRDGRSVLLVSAGGSDARTEASNENFACEQALNRRNSFPTSNARGMQKNAD